MGIELVHFSDCGAFRSCNQDAYCVRIASADCGTIAMVAVCDGMGGLKSGEFASAAVVHALTKWFEQELPALVQTDLESESLFQSWNSAILEVHQALRRYAAEHQIALGTTMSLLLMTEKQYFLAQVGDSRIYLDDGFSIQRITQDQTLAVREYLSGRISEAEFAVHPGHHVLLQCVGNKEVSAEYAFGILPPKGAFLLCSDGFYHTVTDAYLHAVLNSEKGRDSLNAKILQLGEYARSCGERDNMTAVALRWDRFDDMPLKTASLDPQIDDAVCLESYVSVTYTNAPPIDWLNHQLDNK
jgi:serine/threonine protein phosphatase PrpC